MTLLVSARRRAAARLLPGVDEILVWRRPVDRHAARRRSRPRDVTALVDQLRAASIDRPSS